MFTRPRTSSESRVRLRRAARVVLAGGVLASLLAVAPAHADEAADAPVTVDDRVRMQVGEDRRVDVLANDSDPNDHPLAVCRLEYDEDESIFVVAEGKKVGVYAFEPGVYEITYWACDYDYLTAATLTVTVVEPPPVPEVRARKVAGKPGKLRFHNPGKKRVIVLYGSFRREQIDGHLAVGAKSSRTIGATRSKINWVAFVRATGQEAGRGTIRNLKPIREPQQQTEEEGSVIVVGRWPGLR